MKFRDSSGGMNYEIPISNGLLTPEHVRRMGDAVWLELLLEDMVTDGEGEDGIVAGGNPVLDQDLAARLGKSERTIARYREVLAGNYIIAERTSWGHTYKVLRSKKWAVIRRVRLDKSVRSAPTLTGQKCQVSPPPDPTQSGNPQDTTCRSYKETTARPLQEAVEAAAAQTSNLEAWRAIGHTQPFGSPDWRRFWEASYAGRDGQPLSQVMATCADAWQAMGEKVPPQLFRALAEIRRRERETAKPALDDIAPIPPEVLERCR